MRGVRVDIILPEKNNLPYVPLGLRARCGGRCFNAACRIWLTPLRSTTPKLMVVDCHWVLVRLGKLGMHAVLRLNFEFERRVYGRDFATDGPRLSRQAA